MLCGGGFHVKAVLRAVFLTTMLETLSVLGRETLFSARSLSVCYADETLVWVYAVYLDIHGGILLHHGEHLITTSLPRLAFVSS